eukprot:scaffold284300_cov30-Tisochrysis_lutea.AAC.9
MEERCVPSRVGLDPLYAAGERARADTSKPGRRIERRWEETAAGSALASHPLTERMAATDTRARVSFQPRQRQKGPVSHTPAHALSVVSALAAPSVEANAGEWHSRPTISSGYQGQRQNTRSRFLLASPPWGVVRA